MFGKSFRVKIILPTIIVLIALIVTINAFLAVRFSTLSNALLNERLISNTNSLKLYLDESIANTRAAASSMAINADVKNAVKNQDRKELLKLFASVPDLYRISYCAICDDTGTVLARTSESDYFGDSIYDQQNVQDALDHRTSTYFESGSMIKVSVRTGAPVYDIDGAIIGVISAAIRFDTDSQAEALKAIFNSEVTVYLGTERIATTIAQDGNNTIDTMLDPQIAHIVIDNKQEYLGNTEILGKKYKTFYKPLLNAHNETFATIFLGIPEEAAITAINTSIRDGVILGLGGLALSIVLLLFIISTISKPIIVLSNDMNNIANGNLRIDVNVKSKDEVGHLGKSLQKIANILYKLLDDINVMITEHSKGNTDYCLDTGEFHGDFKKLADSVLELSAFGMRDQMTGLPNRRSFDNRLNWEWNRAVRQKTPISILLFDVDKFKNYNDTFGHQQGDVALQTVAKTIKNTLKRSIDFAARWGGEEFIVLLPDTNDAGGVIVADRIRAEIEAVFIPCTDERGNYVTISVGVTTQIPTRGSTVEPAITRADTALYRAKEAGRNRVIYCGEEDV